MCPCIQRSMGKYVMVMSWARVVCLMYAPGAQGHRPEGVYIRQATSAHGMTNIYHFLCVGKCKAAQGFLKLQCIYSGTNYIQLYYNVYCTFFRKVGIVCVCDCVSAQQGINMK